MKRRIKAVRNVIGAILIAFPLALVASAPGTAGEATDDCCKYTNCPGGAIQCASFDHPETGINITCYKGNPEPCPPE